jgi:hypothetical protein
MLPCCTCTAARKPDGYNKAHLQKFEEVLQAWMISQIPDVADGLEQLMCDGKTLSGSAIETDDGSHRPLSHGSDVLLSVKSNQKTLYRLIGCQFVGKRSVRRHLFLTSVRTTSQASLRLIRQRWSLEKEWHSEA